MKTILLKLMKEKTMSNKHIYQHIEEETSVISYVYDRECKACGEKAYADTGFFFEDELYCQDCCPESYGE